MIIYWVEGVNKSCFGGGIGPTAAQVSVNVRLQMRENIATYNSSVHKDCSISG